MPAFLCWDPREDLDSLRREVSRLLEESWAPFRLTRASRPGQPAALLPLDAYAIDEEIVIPAEVPGLSSGDVGLAVEGETLAVRGESRAPMDTRDCVF